MPTAVSSRRGTMAMGELAARLDLQEPSGLTAAGYAPIATGIPANVRSASGNETLKFGGQVSVGQLVITMRYRSDVRASHRLFWPLENRSFQITSYGDETGRQEWLTVYATEVQA